MYAIRSYYVKALFGEEVEHRYAPIDLPWVVRRFLRAYQPRLLILVETEIWPNLIHHAKQAGVPILLANAVITSYSIHYTKLYESSRRRTS